MKVSQFILLPALVMTLSLLLLPQLVDAHVVVRPNKVGVANRETFMVSVPTEKEVPTTQVTLQIPAGLQSARPHVKQGWDIEIVRGDESNPDAITEITWSGGSIPADQMDVFLFNAQAPLEEGELVWKAYQTYADGEVVAWDASPEMIDEEMQHSPDGSEESTLNPYSTTSVVDDLSVDDGHGASAEDGHQEETSSSQTILWVGVLGALALAGYSIIKK
ncbi:MAG: DUF1775 domain-containing protein [Microgenomates group bacterium]